MTKREGDEPENQQGAAENSPSDSSKTAKVPVSSPVSAAMFWVNRATVIVVCLVGPIIGGNFLDQWLGTKFLALLGIAVGMALGIGQLLLLTRVR